MRITGTLEEIQGIINKINEFMGFPNEYSETYGQPELDGSGYYIDIQNLQYEGVIYDIKEFMGII